MSLLKDINDAELLEATPPKGDGWYVLNLQKKEILVSDVSYKEAVAAIRKINNSSTSPETTGEIGLFFTEDGAFYSENRRIMYSGRGWRDLSEEQAPKMGLLKELVNKNQTAAKTQTTLKKSDASDAGKSDVVDKATAGQDIAFSLMRNTINTDGAVTGSDVANYIEKAEELNDEVDTVPFGLETDDGKIVKVYVNAEQADKFEDAMKNMLGMEDDIEEAINRLTTEFDIVDVVWPKSEDEEEGEEDQDADLSIDDTSNLEDDEDDDFGEDQYDVVASVDDNETKQVKSDKDEEAAAEHPDEEDEENPEEDEENPDQNSEEEELDDEGRPKKKKKKKKPAEPEPAEEELDVKQEKNMTFGSRFLERVLNEANGEDTDGVKDSFNIPLDSQARALVAKLKLPFAKRLVAFHVMCGIPGRYLNSEDVETAIAEASDMLRKKVAVRRAFTTFYESLANAKGFTIPAEGVQEARRTREVVEDEIAALNKKIVQAGKDGTRRSLILDMEKKLTRLRSELKLMKEELEEAKKTDLNPEKLMKAKDAVKKAKTALKDHEKTYDGGNGARARKLQADLEKAQSALAKLTEELLHEAPRQKRGSYMQKLLEAVMTQLGLPESLISTSGPSAVGTGIYRTAELVEQDSTLEQNLRALATRLGIKANDAQAPVEEGKAIMREAIDLGTNDDFADAVLSLVSSLGIPDAVLTSRKPQLIQGLRQRKAQLRNRQQVVTMMQRLEGILTKNTITAGGQPEEETPAPGGRPNVAQRNQQ